MMPVATASPSPTAAMANGNLMLITKKWARTMVTVKHTHKDQYITHAHTCTWTAAILVAMVMTPTLALAMLLGGDDLHTASQYDDTGGGDGDTGTYQFMAVTL